MIDLGVGATGSDKARLFLREAHARVVHVMLPITRHALRCRLTRFSRGALKLDARVRPRGVLISEVAVLVFDDALDWGTRFAKSESAKTRQQRGTTDAEVKIIDPRPLKVGVPCIVRRRTKSC